MNAKRLLNTFLELVAIDSPSKGEAAVAAYCQQVLKACGCTVQLDTSATLTGSDTGNLFAVLPAKGSPTRADSAGGTTNPSENISQISTFSDPFCNATLCFSAHMDCVPPCMGVEPYIRDGVIYSRGTTVLGGDDKVGIAAILELVASLAENDRPHPSITVILSVQEEVGLIGAKSMRLAPYAKAGDFCYVLDAAGQPGTVINAAPYQHSYRATYTGLAAHAGIAPECGISAIQVAARAVAALPQGRLDHITTANVGTITGGVANNIVAPQCVVTGECRSHDLDRLLAVRAQIDTILKTACPEDTSANLAPVSFAASTQEQRIQAEGAQTSQAQAEDAGPAKELAEGAQTQQAEDVGPAQEQVEWEVNYVGFYASPSSPEVILALEAAHALGLPAALERSGGGADTNVFVAQGLRAVSLGSGMDQVHTTDERLSIVDLENLARWIIEISYQFNGGEVKARARGVQKC
ncbi:MAG: M20/M25/M40 family metallo-hydrolase [Coriobacteriales bacterium]|jgi:tripeptide aminopeptidase|nr:M20/M25/M40 family metallo-hydrolase [Coriobacteriales bacterium]